MNNINTKAYWDNRFKADWEKKSGRSQTADFAKDQIPYFDISSDFDGSILDFGCGLGDAIPIYKKSYPNAKLYGVDISSVGIEKCKKTYGCMADFTAGTEKEMRDVDIVIASNVFEHLTDDKKIAEKILQKTKVLYIIVPYKEKRLMNEHVNSYDEFYFSEFNVLWFKIFFSRGWTESGFRLFRLRARNCIRFLAGKEIQPRSRQIMFCLTRDANS